MCRVEQANAEEFYEVSTSGGFTTLTLQPYPWFHYIQMLIWIKPSQILDIYRSLLPLVDNMYETLRSLHERA